MVTVILVLLIPAAYFIGRYAQWRTDFRRMIALLQDRRRLDRRW